MSDAPVPPSPVPTGPARPRRSCSASRDRAGRDSPRAVLTLEPRLTGADHGSSMFARVADQMSGAAVAIRREDDLAAVLAHVRLDVVRAGVVQLGDRRRGREAHVACFSLT